MRKLKLQMQMSLDGFVSTGPNDDQTWVTWAIDEIKGYVLELLDSADTILIGRKLAIDYIPYWQDVFAKPEHPMHDIATRIVSTRKVVFTKTLKESQWENTKVANEDLAYEINRLKSQPGKDLIVYGGSSFVANLIRERLIDEFHFFVNPVVLGRGVSVFEELDEFQQLKLNQSIVYNCGIVMLEYRLK